MQRLSRKPAVSECAGRERLTEEVGEPVPEADAEPEPVADAEAEAELQGSVRYAHVTYESARHEVDEPDMMTTAEE